MNSKVTLPGYSASFSLSRGWHGLSALIVATVLMACGGGGGNTPPDVSTPAETLLTLGGSISGLGQATGLTLINGAETLVIAAGANAFTFATKLTSNLAYNVTVGAQPNGLTCSVTNGSGTMAGAVSSVVVGCSASEIGGETNTSTIALFAGNLRGGYADGIGAAARFGGAEGIAIDSTGIVYVADVGNHIIRKITPAGMVSTLAGTAGVQGSADGAGPLASFDSPKGIATDTAGNVYVTDNSKTIRKITPTGVVSTLAGTRGIYGNADGIGAAASFDETKGIATDRAGNIYVADARIIRKITPTGVVSTLAGTRGVFGNADGVGAAASFVNPHGLATDSAGNVYVADANFDSSVIRKITPTGVVSTLAGTPGVYGHADGIGSAASFTVPMGIATDSAGNVYVSSSYALTIRKITPSGVVSTLAGMPGTYGTADGTGAGARFLHATGVATDSAGNIFVADANAIRKVTPNGIVSTWAGSAGYGSSDGVGTVASFREPAGIAADSAGNIYVADRLNRTIRKVTPTGAVSTLAGTPGVSGSADGFRPLASFNDPKGIATDKAGNVYVSEKTIVRKITPAGMVSTLAGTSGSSGSANGMGPLASFSDLGGVATDSVGNVFVTDRGNHTIRKITPAGMVSTLAGTAGVAGSANGIGSAASFDCPSGIATDSAGNVYVIDGECTVVGYSGIDGDHWVDAVSSRTHAIRKITPDGLVSTVLSPLDDLLSYYGSTVHGIAIDSAGNIYESIGYDPIMAFYHLTPYSTIRKTTPAGVVSTVVGVPQDSPFVSGPLPGSLREAGWLAISGTSLYITMPNVVVVVRNMP